MDNLTEINGAAETAEAEKGEAATALGKFKDVQTLLKAYSDLEAEFTRRCQRLKELERGNKAADVPDGEQKPSSGNGGEGEQKTLVDDKVRDAVISDYLKSLAAKTVPLATGGGAVAAPKNTPKSVEEAGRLARRFFNG